MRIERDFFKNNAGVLLKTDIHVEEKPIIHPDLVTSLMLVVIQPLESKAPYLPKSYGEAKKRPDFIKQWFLALKQQYDILMKKT